MDTGRNLLGLTLREEREYNTQASYPYQPEGFRTQYVFQRAGQNLGEHQVDEAGMHEELDFEPAHVPTVAYDLDRDARSQIVTNRTMDSRLNDMQRQASQTHGYEDLDLRQLNPSPVRGLFLRRYMGPRGGFYEYPELQTRTRYYADILNMDRDGPMFTRLGREPVDEEPDEPPNSGSADMLYRERVPPGTDTPPLERNDLFRRAARQTVNSQMEHLRDSAKTDLDTAMIDRRALNNLVSGNQNYGRAADRIDEFYKRGPYDPSTGQRWRGQVGESRASIMYDRNFPRVSNEFMANHSADLMQDALNKHDMQLDYLRGRLNQHLQAAVMADGTPNPQYSQYSINELHDMHDRVTRAKANLVHTSADVEAIRRQAVPEMRDMDTRINAQRAQNANRIRDYRVPTQDAFTGAPRGVLTNRDVAMERQSANPEQYGHALQFGDNRMIEEYVANRDARRAAEDHEAALEYGRQMRSAAISEGTPTTESAAPTGLADAHQQAAAAQEARLSALGTAQQARDAVNAQLHDAVNASDQIDAMHDRLAQQVADARNDMMMEDI